jgi:molybdopterin/thiamine biosynthesis adenylyltransferase
MYATDDIDQPKARLAAIRLKALNPDISINAFEKKLDRDNAVSLIAGYDIVVDARTIFLRDILSMMPASFWVSPLSTEPCISLKAM